MGPHTDGGGLIDADIQRRSPEYANGHGNDQLADICNGQYEFPY